MWWEVAILKETYSYEEREKLDMRLQIVSTAYGATSLAVTAVVHLSLTVGTKYYKTEWKGEFEEKSWMSKEQHTIQWRNKLISW